MRVRLVAGGVVALVVLVALQWYVGADRARAASSAAPPVGEGAVGVGDSRRDGAARVPRGPGVSPAAFARATATADGEVRDPGVGTRASLPRVLREAGSPVWLIYFAVDSGDLPRRVAPAFALDPTGAVRVLRPPPVADGPSPPPWLGVGIVIPGQESSGPGRGDTWLDPERWTPGIRGRVLEILDTLSARRSIGLEQCVGTGGARLPRGAWRRLFAWRRR